MLDKIKAGETTFNWKTREGCGFPGVYLGVPEENSRKALRKSRKISPISRNATNSRISGTGKGKPAANLGSALPGPCPHLPCGVFFEIDSASLLEFTELKYNHRSDM